MGDHLVLCVDRFTKPESLQSLQGNEAPGSSSEGSCSQSAELPTCAIDVKGVGEKEEDSVKNLEVPCACSGSLKFAHRKCVQRWCNEKGDITCEICHQPYQPGYTAPPPPPQSEDTTIDISEGWTISGTPLDLRDPRLLAMAAAERHFLEAEYDEYADTNASGAAFCRSAALILMALLLLRHALTLPMEMGMMMMLQPSFLCSCSGPLVFFSHATLWLGPSAYYNVEGKDRRQQHLQQLRLHLCCRQGNDGACSSQ
ncbi:uncharacterized protein Pyn_16405 [Prunus yedoensis var. nudiflora]|uniref:RING-CH-type domain-containing protein n=1 Tax=Prunus yedoensis var. nudiflora TaxID=2094558 RepID=A0A314YY57_PRUYE|nr:uncharacterized protein Pyn_16405 [Prunus yedoensis var. nudiflora]